LVRAPRLHRGGR